METTTMQATAKRVRLDTYVMKGQCREKALDTYHLILAPTFACNLRCRHCYLPDHATRGLPAARVLRLVDEWSEIVVADRGPFRGIFHLKGGEPLILPYLSQVLDLLAERRTLRFMMTTNGTLGRAEILDRLDRLNSALDGHAIIIVSVDGSNEAIHAQLRGHGNFDQTVTFVRRLTESGVNVHLNNVVHQGNVADMAAFVELALELGATQVNFLSFVPKGFGESLAQQRPDPVEVFERTQAIWDRGDERVRRLLSGSLSDIQRAESGGGCTSCECVGGYRGLLYIEPDGTTYSCPNLNHPGLEAGNIMAMSLPDVHNALQAKVYDRIRTVDGDRADRYLCKGERFLPLSRAFLEQGFRRLQGRLSAPPSAQGTSYCFSRNF